MEFDVVVDERQDCFPCPIGHNNDIFDFPLAL